MDVREETLEDQKRRGETWGPDSSIGSSCVSTTYKSGFAKT